MLFIAIDLVALDFIYCSYQAEGFQFTTLAISRAQLAYILTTAIIGVGFGVWLGTCSGMSGLSMQL
jgi:hypothetical protein